MNSPDEKPFWGDKVVKRGSGGRDPSSPKSRIGTSPSDFHRPVLASPIVSSSPAHESKLGSTTYRPGRGLENSYWMPKRYIFAIVCLLSLFALSGSFLFGQFYWYPSQIVGSDGSLAFSDRWRQYASSHELDLKDNAWKTEVRLQTDGGATCDPELAALKVYMYDLPSEYHFGMMDSFEPSLDPNNVWPRNISNLPRYPGGLYQQHSPEYWFTVDILTSDQPGRKFQCTAVRVKNYKDADIIWVPYFASYSYNKYNKLEHKEGESINDLLQEKLVEWLKNQRPWQESGGVDHVVVIHHPNSLHVVRHQLSSAMYIVCDFGRYPEEVANIRKDIVAPYKHVMGSYMNDRSTFESRKLLLFFQGAIVRKEGGAIRQQLNELLKDEEGVQFVTGNTQSTGIKSATAGMRNSKFCLHLAGDTPSSNRLFDAIASHCVPVVISDAIELPYEDALDYSEFCIFVPARLALNKGDLIKLLRGIEREEWTRMWTRLQEVARHFDYQHPSLPDDAVNMVWKAIARRAPWIKYRVNKSKRYARSGLLQAQTRAMSLTGYVQ